MVAPLNKGQKSFPGTRKAFELISERALRAYGKKLEKALDKRLYHGRIAEYEASFEPDAPTISTKVSLLITTYNTDPNLLRACINSALHQTYAHIEICIADDSSERKDTISVIDEAKIDPRVKVMFRDHNGHIAAATNTAFSLACGEWVAVLDHDDLLHPRAIAEVVHAIRRNPSAQLLYSDEDKIDSRERRFAPFFKPAFSPELLRSQNYINHLAVYRADVVKRLGGWREGFDGSQDYDLNLRIAEQADPGQIVHIPKILYHWRATTGSTALSSAEKSYAYDAGKRALGDHARRLQVIADVKAVPGSSYYRFAPRLPAHSPLVSIIVRGGPNSETTARELKQLISKTRYETIEIVVIKEASSETFDSEILGAFPTIRLLTMDKSEQYPVAYNRAVATAKGELICILGRELQPQNEDWLGQLVAAALLDGVGCVGPKLIYPDQTVHSAGIVLGAGGMVDYSYQNHRNGASGYFARLKLTHNVSAVSSLCLVTKKPQFQAVGGFNQRVCYGILNDVDLALRMRQMGLRHVIEPAIELAFLKKCSQVERPAHENVAFENDYSTLLETWGDCLRKDPYYSRNQALSGTASLFAEGLRAAYKLWMSKIP